MKTADILDRSLMKLKEQTGVEVVENSPPSSALITITWHNDKDENKWKSNLEKKEVYLEIKHDVGDFAFKAIVLSNSSKSEILNHFHNTKKDTIFISPYFTNATIDFLIEKKINFIDTAGNTYLLKKGLYFLIKGHKKPDDIEVAHPKRIFQEAGLKILFVLLNNIEAINFTYREIAKLSKTSASSVQYVFEELEDMGFLLNISKKKRKLINRQKLLERWSIAYGENLKPKLHRGYFRFKYEIPKKKLKTLPNTLPNTYWGGELGAEIITRYLYSQKFTLYSSERFSKLVKELLIIPTKKEDSDLELIEVFWEMELNNNSTSTAPNILIYADLYNSLIERNLETAQKLLENELQYLL